MTAVPPAVSCAVPRTAEFTQKAAEASQKVTKPGEIGVLKSVVVTVAVKVTTVPLATEAEDNVRPVVVAAPRARLAGVATVAKSRASTVEKAREKEREPNF
jgi:hypothetical protein